MLAPQPVAPNTPSKIDCADTATVLWLDDPACRRVGLVGGKAANLSRVAELARVPPGFCLPATAYDPAVAAEIAHALQEGDRDGGALAPERLHAALPAHVRRSAADAYRTLAARCGAADLAAAVRSSAVDEDGAAASFAGQHDTYLNVAGVDAVLAAVGRCWASALAPRALEYRRQQGLRRDGSLAVLVQQLVPADVSAVLFSAHPLTSDRDVVVITASWGLGESVVGGMVTPDTYVVRKADLAVLERTPGAKERMTVAVPGGTKEVDVPRLLRSRLALDDRQVVEMALLAIELEASTGWAVDVECAYGGGDLFLLQCRPITTLALGPRG